jgi:HEAT repeat protein/beta-lactamase regulating signal transducer with metallopeptidase domain
VNTALLSQVLVLAATVGAAWLLTYAVHSTVLIGTVWAASRLGALRSLRVRDLAWRTALVGGLFTATLQMVAGHHPWAGSTALRAPALPAASEVASALGAAREPPSTLPVKRVVGAGVPEGSTPTPPAAAPTSGEKMGLATVPPAAAAVPATPVVAQVQPPTTEQLKHALQAQLLPKVVHAMYWYPDRSRWIARAAVPAPLPVPSLPVVARPVTGPGVRWDAPPIFVLWMGIATALILRLAFLRARVLAALGERTQVVEPLVLARLAGLCRDVQHARAVKLTTASGLRSPVALGWGEICLPAQALDRLDGAQQRSVLAHELAHLRRLDPVWLLVASVMEQLFFFQPLNRLARARMQEVAEYLCDDWAAARDGSGLSVAQGLASVAAWIDGRETVVPLAGMAERPSQLLTRVQRLLQRGAGEVERLRAWHVCGAITLLVVTVLAAPGVRAAPEQSLLAARRTPLRSSLVTDAGAKPNPAATTRVMVAVQAIDSSLLDSAGSASSGDSPAAKEAPTPAPASDRAPATKRKHEDPAPGSDSPRMRKPSRSEDAPLAPRGERTQPSPAVAMASSADAATTEAPVATVRSVTAFAPATLVSPRVVAALSTLDTVAVTPAILASVPPVPPLPPVPPVAAVPPVPPVPTFSGNVGMSQTDIERMQRDAQRMARDAQRRAQEAVRRAQARTHGRHGKGRHTERTPADPKTVDALVSALKDSDPGVRQAAAESLGRIGDPRAIEPLGGLLNDPSIDVRRAAVEALGNVDDPKVVPALSKAAGDANPAVRREAAEALLGVDDEAATAPLVKLLSDSDPKVRVTALEGLSRRGDKRALEPLGKLVKDPNVEVRSRAVRALARFRDPASQTALVTALKDENAEVRAAAAEALGELELRSAPQGLLDATRDSNADVRQATAEALGQIHDAKAVPQLKALLEDASPEVRSAAVEALSEIRDSSALQALITAMQSKDVTVRRAAAEALGQRE